MAMLKKSFFSLRFTFFYGRSNAEERQSQLNFIIFLKINLMNAWELFVGVDLVVLTCCSPGGERGL
jgi:hypothetical protein